MKLRVRSSRGGATVKVEVPPLCSLHGLKDAIAQTLASNGIPFVSPVRLSLNKVQELDGHDSSLLSQCGIRAGDLLFYLESAEEGLDVNQIGGSAGPAGISTLQGGAKLTGHANGTNERNTKTCRELCAEAAVRRASSGFHAFVDSSTLLPHSGSVSIDNVHERVGKPEIAKSVVHFASVTDEMRLEQVDVDDMCVDNMNTIAENVSDYMYVEHVSSSSSLKAYNSIPSLLQRVLIHEQKNARYPDQLLLLATHAVMLETGFKICNTSGEENSLPHDWVFNGVVSLHYMLEDVRLNAENSDLGRVTLRHQTVGGTLVIYGFTDTGTTPSIYRLSMQSSKYLADNALTNGDLISAFSDIFDLWKCVKDGLSLPLLTAVCERAGLPVPASLSIVPIELKMRILECLSALDLLKLGSTCSELRHLCANDELWKRLFIKEFGDPRAQMPHGFSSWKGFFQEKFVDRKRAVERLGRRYGSHQPFYGVSSRFPSRRPPCFGGIIGGDYDLFPSLGSGPSRGGFWGTRGPLGGLHERFRVDGLNTHGLEVNDLDSVLPHNYR